MAWNVQIQLRNADSVTLSNLKSINTQSSSDSSITSLTDFEKFHLVQNQRLIFISEEHIYSINSSDIVSVLFKKIK